MNNRNYISNEGGSQNVNITPYYANKVKDDVYYPEMLYDNRFVNPQITRYDEKPIVNNPNNFKKYKEIKEEKFDLVLLDLIMPEVTGDELYYTIREISPGQKIIVMTGQLMNKTISKEYTFIQKPFEINELLTAINEMFIPITYL